MNKVSNNVLLQDLYSNYCGVNDIPNLNRGGCGVVAEDLYKALVDLGFKPKILFLTDNVEMMKKRFVDNKRYAKSACIVHIVIQLDDKYIDSTGVYDSIECFEDKYWMMEGVVETDIETLHKFNVNADIWNESFNRENIPLVDKYLHEAELKVKKELEVTE